MASNSENGFCDSSRSQNANIGVTGPRSKAHQLHLPSEGSRGELVPGLSVSGGAGCVSSSVCISPMCVSSSLLSASNPSLPLPYKILHLGSLLIIQDNLPNSKFSTESHLSYIDLFFPFIRQHKFQRPGTDIFVGGGGRGIIQLTPPSNDSPPQQFWVLSINIRGPFCYYSSINGEGNGNLLQYSCLENSMDKGAWWATVHNIANS